jgi:hypothetical protein
VDEQEQTVPFYKPANNDPPFRCPICRTAYFGEVTVKKGNGQYTTEFLQCAGCTAMFMDPVKFTKSEPYHPPRPSEADERREARRKAYFTGRDE